MFSGIPAFVLSAAATVNAAENSENLGREPRLLRPKVVVLVIVRVGRTRNLRQRMFL
jgi:hypothetical protein